MLISRSSASLLFLGLDFMAKTSAQSDDSTVSGSSEPLVDEIPGAIDPADLPLVGDETAELPVAGGWLQMDVTATEVALLAQVSRTASWDVEDVRTPGVCVLELLQLEMQVVDGFQYQFGVRGCAVDSKDELGACEDVECAAASYQVDVYAPFWEKEMQVTSVALLG